MSNCRCLRTDAFLMERTLLNRISWEMESASLSILGPYSSILVKYSSTGGTEFEGVKSPLNDPLNCGNSLDNVFRMIAAARPRHRPSLRAPREDESLMAKLDRQLVPGSAKLVREVSLYPSPQTIYRTCAAMLNLDW